VANLRFRARITLIGALAAALSVVATRQPTDAVEPPAADAIAAVAFAGGASASARATRLPSVSDVVTINRLGPMRAADVAALESLATRLGVPSQRGRSFNIGMTSIRRDGSFVQVAAGPGGLWQFPMAVTALPVEALGQVMSHRVSSVAASGGVVLSSTSAGLRGAAAGDLVDLVGETGSTVTVRLGAVVPDDEIGGAELVMSTDTADRLGVTTVTRIVLFGQFDRNRLMAELAQSGFVDGVGVRIVRSWGPPNPDGLLGSSQVKLLLGEFDYRVNSDDSLSLDAGWIASSLPASRRVYDSIAVRARCHLRVHADLQAALDEVAASGLAGAIDLVNTNTYGGCFNPRYARLSQSTGSISRHAWGMAIDMNTATNAQGYVPQMDCRVVRIFRAHGFAWGGNFLVADGMHFEWVGEPRHTWQYPSAYCPNIAAISGADVDGAVGPERTSRSTLFAESGFPESGESGR
jgi:hypothetical protein